MDSIELTDDERKAILESRAKKQATADAEKPAQNITEYFRRAGINPDLPITGAQIQGVLEYLAPHVFAQPEGHAPSPLA